MNRYFQILENRISDIGKAIDLPILKNRIELLISENKKRFTDIGSVHVIEIDWFFQYR